MHPGGTWLALLSPLLAGSLAAQVRLPDVRATGRTGCQIHPESAEATAELWIDARRTLESAAATGSAPPTLLIQRWRKQLGSNLGLRWERRDTLLVTTHHPFGKDAPGNLERDGYIQSRRDVVTYYGPGLDLLLSDHFLRKHCFRRLEGTGAWAGLIGLAFEPLPSQWKTDVAGVLWIDPILHALRQIEYTWTSPPLESQAPALGGRAEFIRLADGAWIIQRWNIRMPRASDFGGGGTNGYTDQGGEVLAVALPRRGRR